MANSVFVDNDVLIDFLIERAPFSDSAAQIFNLAETNIISIYTSVICLANTHYILRKGFGEEKTRLVLGELMTMITVLDVTQANLMAALHSEFRDFEDAIQYSVAKSSPDIAAIITRNTKDYSKSEIPVFDPPTFISLVELNN